MATGSLNMIIRLLVNTGSSAASINSLKNSLIQLAGVVAGLNIVDQFIEANREIDKLIRGLNAISGGNQVAYFERLVGAANKLGIPLKEVSLSFLELNAATRETDFEGQKTQDIFEALGNALSVTGADSVRFQRGFRALTQVLSKDQLFAEELRQQLGEALPTAVQDFAHALDITPLKLFNFMKQGVISGDELRRTLVLVTNEWNRAYPVIDKKNFTVDQKLALVRNQFLLLSKAIGDTGVWEQFGNSIDLIGASLLYIKNNMNDVVVDVKATFNTIRDEIRATDEDLKSRNINIGESFSNVEFSPTGLIRNFRAVFSLLEGETREGLRPIEDAISNIDFSKITIGFLATAQAAVRAFGVMIGGAIDSINSIGPLSKTIEQEFITIGARIKSAYVDVVEFVSIKIQELQNSFTRSKVNVRWTQLFGTEEELNNLFNDINALDNKYKESAKSSEDRKKAASDGYKKEQDELKRLQGVLSNLAASTKSNLTQSFQEIGKGLTSSFNNLDANKVLETQKILLAEERKMEEQRALNDKERVQRLEDETRAKTGTLKITKQQATAESDLIKLSHTYKDSLVSVNNEQYKRWVQEGLITEEAGKFFEQSAKSESLRTAWNAAIEAVERYNKEADRGAKADQGTLDALKNQANEQLSYAAAKAKEAGDAYKLKQIYESQVGIIERQKQAIQDIRSVLDKAEIKAGIKNVPGDEVKNVVSDVQKQFDAITPATVPTKVDPARQDVFRDYEDPITKLPDAIQYVNRIYKDGSSSSSSIVDPTSGFRFGGQIPGYGGGDRIRALLEPGEFVMRKEAVRSLGLGFLSSLNQSGIASASVPRFDVGSIGVPRFASGGPVESQPIVINVAGRSPIRLSGSRDQAEALANLLTGVGRAL
jgi:tape measure domain-containing protein